MSDLIEKETRRMRWFGHLIVYSMVLYFAYRYLNKHNYYGTLDYAILPFHEAGHFLFGILGQTPGVAGGTIVQICLPLAFAIYFVVKKKEYFSGMVAFFWMSQTLLQIATYMKDARFQILPLFGGSDDIIHDWHYLFGKMKLLHESVEIGERVEGLGVFLIWMCLFGMTAWIVRTSPFWPGSSEIEE